jgi:L-asparaginase
VVAEVARLTERGVVVGLTTRVPGGPVYARYGGGGGGVDLVAAGAVPMGTLPSSQARMLLAVLVDRFGDPAEVRRELVARIGRLHPR